MGEGSVPLTTAANQCRATTCSRLALRFVPQHPVLYQLFIKDVKSTSQIRPRYLESEVVDTRRSSWRLMFKDLMALIFKDGFDYVPNLESTLQRPEEDSRAHTIFIMCRDCHLQIDMKLEPGHEIAASSIVCPVCQRIFMQSPEGQPLWIKANE